MQASGADRPGAVTAVAPAPSAGATTGDRDGRGGRAQPAYHRSPELRAGASHTPTCPTGRVFSRPFGSGASPRSAACTRRTHAGCADATAALYSSTPAAACEARAMEPPPPPHAPRSRPFARAGASGARAASIHAPQPEARRPWVGEQPSEWLAAAAAAAAALAGRGRVGMRAHVRMSPAASDGGRRSEERRAEAARGRRAGTETCAARGAARG